jgi:hypothetical protein
LGVFSLFFSQNQPKLHPSLGQNRAREPKFPPSSSSFLHPTEVGRRSSHLRPKRQQPPLFSAQSSLSPTAPTPPQQHLSGHKPTVFTVSRSGVFFSQQLHRRDMNPFASSPLVMSPAT